MRDLIIIRLLFGQIIIWWRVFIRRVFQVILNFVFDNFNILIIVECLIFHLFKLCRSIPGSYSLQSSFVFIFKIFSSLVLIVLDSCACFRSFDGSWILGSILLNNWIVASFNWLRCQSHSPCWFSWSILLLCFKLRLLAIDNFFRDSDSAFSAELHDIELSIDFHIICDCGANDKLTSDFFHSLTSNFILKKLFSFMIKLF